MNTYDISTDRSRLDIALIHRYLSEESYWAKGVSREVVERSIENSICIGAYEDGTQVGFARLVTDSATFVWLADVFVVEGHRGRGVGKRLVETALDHADVRGARRWVLATHDAHELYEPFGFRSLAGDHRFMVIEPPTGE